MHQKRNATRSLLAILAIVVTCTHAGAQEKIIGGTDAPAGAYPWSAALVNNFGAQSNRDAYLCGGVLVHPQIVMTAAHCIFPFSNTGFYFHERTPLLPHEFSVIVNTDDISNASATRLPVDEVMIHPDFFERTDRSLLNDIALIRLQDPVDSPYLRTATDPARLAPGVLATVAGWGTISWPNITYPTRLQAVDVPIISNADAAVQHSGVFPIEPFHLAAGFVTGGKDACQGDSGAALMVPGPCNGWQLAGLVSFGDGCAKPDAPGMYTRVLDYRDWYGEHLFPELLDWEQANGVMGMDGDPDGDGLANFYEFATGGDPDQARPFDQPRSTWLSGPAALGLTTRYRADIPWIRFQPEHAPALPNAVWTPFDFNTSFEGAPRLLSAQLREVTLRHPVPATGANSLGFMRFRPELAGAPAQRLQARANHTGRLVFGQATNADGRFMDTLELVNFPTSGINGVQVTMTATTFDPFLYLIDFSTGAVITSNDDGGIGNSAAIVIPAGGSTRYAIGASGNAPNVTGSYFLTSETF